MRVAFALARYGREVLGGAETLAAGLVQQAAAAGWDVEVWTTCAVDYASWQNEFPAGTAVEEGVIIRRFPVDPWDPTIFHALNSQLQRRRVLPIDSQYNLLASGPHSSALVSHAEQHAAEFDAVIVMPYLHSLSYDVALVAGERLVFWPCLHDEPYAYMEPYRLLFEGAWGTVFISPEEASLALDGLKVKLARSAVIGSGVNLETAGGSVAPHPYTRQPYLLYIGRLDPGKNVPLLYDYISHYATDGGRLRLLVAGDGVATPPDHAAITALGRISEAEKGQLLQGAVALCQPSFNESVSLVMMEAWLAGRPALVWGDCAVTRGHVQRSKGGLWFNSYETFRDAADWFLTYPEQAQRMGTNGRAYVQANYTWPLVFQRFADTLARWQREAAQ